MYSPSLGRWTQVDPIGFEAGDPNLYRFVGNNPVNLVDPSGLDPKKTVSSFPGGILTLDGNALELALNSITTTTEADAEAAKIALAIRNTFKNNSKFTFPSITKDERCQGYYCYEWAYAFEDAFATESTGKYFIARVEGANATDESGRVHFWLRIQSKETGKFIYVDDGFTPGKANVHIKRPEFGIYEYANMLDTNHPRTKCDVPPARDSSNNKK